MIIQIIRRFKFQFLQINKNTKTQLIKLFKQKVVQNAKKKNITIT